jgi:hypothetical protein
MNISDAFQAMIDSGAYVESGGPNRGPAIDALCTEFGYTLGSPWCALAFCHAAKQCWAQGLGRQVPYTASSQELLARLAAVTAVSVHAGSLMHWRGAVAIWTQTDASGNPTGRGHVALVQRRLTNHVGDLVAIGTAEGNTNDHQGREGDRAMNHVRPVPQPGRWTYCKLDPFAGGSYW